MNFVAVARGWNVRAVPWLTWLLLAFGVVYFGLGVLPPGFSPVGSLANAGPIFFAAAVVYVHPIDRRFRWAALALAASPVVALLAHWIPIIWQQVASGSDWANALGVLNDMGTVAIDVAAFIVLVGLFVFGSALGGVRAFLSAVLIAAGAGIALLDLVWLFAHPVDQMPLFQLAKSVVYPTLTALGWAFLFAAALESLRSLTLVGAGLCFANVVVGTVLLWWSIGANANTDLLSLIVAGPLLAGWLALTAGALRGELDEPGPGSSGTRSRAGRGSGARRRAG